MKRYEKFILIFISFVILSRIFAFLLDVYIARLGITNSMAVDYPALYSLRGALPYLSHIITAIWLFSESPKRFGGRFVWTALGLMTGLVGVAVFYTLQIWVTLRENQKNQAA